MYRCINILDLCDLDYKIGGWESRLEHVRPDSKLRILSSRIQLNWIRLKRLLIQTSNLFRSHHRRLVQWTTQKSKRNVENYVNHIGYISIKPLDFPVNFPQTSSSAMFFASLHYLRPLQSFSLPWLSVPIALILNGSSLSLSRWFHSSDTRFSSLDSLARLVAANNLHDLARRMCWCPKITLLILAYYCITVEDATRSGKRSTSTTWWNAMNSNVTFLLHLISNSTGQKFDVWTGST